MLQLARDGVKSSVSVEEVTATPAMFEKLAGFAISDPNPYKLAMKMTAESPSSIEVGLNSTMDDMDDHP